MPLLPLRGVIVFPYTLLHLDVGRKKSVNAIEEAMMNGKKIFLAAQKESQQEDPAGGDVYAYGTVAEVKQIMKMPGGALRVLVEGLYRGKMVDYLEGPYFASVAVEEYNYLSVPEAMEESLGSAAYGEEETEALRRQLRKQFEHYARSSKRIPPETISSVLSIEDPGRLADVITSHLTLKIEDKQKILEALDVKWRLNTLLNLLAQEADVLEWERTIGLRVKQQMNQTQKEYYLREQLRAIQKELGDSGEGLSETESLRAKLAAAALPAEPGEKVSREIERLEHMPALSAETVVSRNYIEWVLALPWNQTTRDRLNLTQAANILERDHYALRKPKERILEFLAIRKLAKALTAPILCLVGPPGVGKTSLGKSVAASLGRSFVQMSLGGVRDEAEIRGHRRTYVGAMPGRILQQMRQAGVRNPVFLLDEIDKMANDFRGDPASAMLEVLDPEQNNHFSDHYLDMPFDLSKVLFITTANSAHAIPAPLLDRMELIEIPGYTEEEKLQIARRHLAPRELKAHGLKPGTLSFSDSALQRIISDYTREAGVRELKRQIDAVCRKTARRVVEDKNYKLHLSANRVESFLGAPKYHHGLAEEEARLGVASGLAVTAVGGDVLTIEAVLLPGKGELTLTGNLGEVMKESAQTALTYVKSIGAELEVAPEQFAQHAVHIHVPEGATPKDGPSAGITMASALASVFSGRKVASGLAMTGEVTLRGRVLPIGGLKEKVLAAHRIGIWQLIIPEDNLRDLEDIPASIRKKITFYPVKNMGEVLKKALLPREDEK
jgi:ATP-dependent Lon protease